MYIASICLIVMLTYICMYYFITSPQHIGIGYVNCNAHVSTKRMCQPAHIIVCLYITHNIGNLYISRFKGDHNRKEMYFLCENVLCRAISINFLFQHEIYDCRSEII